MCLSIPSKVVKIDTQNNVATVDTMGVQRTAGLDLMEDGSVQIGDYVLLHIGFIMNKIDEADALESLNVYREIIEAMEEEERRAFVEAGDNCPAREAPMSGLELKDLYDGFRDAGTIKAYAKIIAEDAQKLPHPINIMEVCGGHTHTIMKYGILQLLPSNIHFVHGPGCPVCIMPKERIDHAYLLSMQENVILVTLGDMIKVPGSNGSLQDARAKGADVRFVYSPLDCLKIAHENPDKTVIFFAIGFETTTPMTAALLDTVIRQDVKNILLHVNHVTVPEPMRALISDKACIIDAFLGPSHVSVISGSKIYEEFPRDWGKPVVVSGFEPVDVMQSISMIVKQFIENRCELEVEYKRAVTREGNLKAKALNDTYFQKVDFRWRGLGDIPQSGMGLKPEYDRYNAEKIYDAILPKEEINDHKLCICGDILKGKASPPQCSIFGTACKPTTPVGSCMVSSEGACSAYYKYGNLI